MKHKNDIFRLSNIIMETSTIKLPAEVKMDVMDFFEKIKAEDIDLKNLNIASSKDDILQRYRKIFCIE